MKYLINFLLLLPLCAAAQNLGYITLTDSELTEFRADQLQENLDMVAVRDMKQQIKMQRKELLNIPATLPLTDPTCAALVDSIRSAVVTKTAITDEQKQKLNKCQPPNPEYMSAKEQLAVLETKSVGAEEAAHKPKQDFIAKVTKDHMVDMSHYYFNERKGMFIPIP